jgi:FixJ family two-component response regulator
MDAQVIHTAVQTVGRHLRALRIKPSPLVVVTSTVFVIDDDTYVRESVAQLIRAAGWRAKTFKSAEEFLSQSDGTTPCCIVLDIALPGLSGLELQTHLRGRGDTPLIFITSSTDVQMTVRAMKAGAFDFLTKPFDDEVLLDAIRRAIDRSQRALKHELEMSQLRNCYASLSRREREVMALVVLGLLNKQVSAELGISEITVKAHRGHMMRKMNADSLPDLVAMAAVLGLPVGACEKTCGIEPASRFQPIPAGEPLPSWSLDARSSPSI